MQWRKWLFCMVSLSVFLGGPGWVGASSGRHGTKVLSQGRRFAPKGTRKKYARDTPYLIKHLRLELKFLPAKRFITGQAIFDMVAHSAPITHVVLDAAELQIKEVWINKKKAKWQGVGHKLHIETGVTMHPNKPFKLRVVYSATPRTGLHFVLPDKAYPKRPLHVFSQGESEDNRFWFPSFDYTNMRFTSETVFTVPKPLMVVTNGKLFKKTETKKFVTYHHKMKHNHVNYLLAVAIGVFKVYEQRWNKILIRSLVPPEDFDKAARSFKNTADMMKFFSESIGVVYPYSKYDQVTVHRFVAGGMENITVTILTHGTLHDAKAHLTWRSDGLVAHELAHQWFGDLLTCVDWSHLWLNESFATYFDKLYVEHKWGEDEFDSERHRMLGWYWRSSYQRPIQTSKYEFAGDMFDSHSYPKGAAVLHMIRTILGDRLWWDAINFYVTTNAHGLVETSDLRRSIEVISGKNWKPFFDQWVYRAGHPNVHFSWRYDRKNKQVIATFKQTNKRPYKFGAKLYVTNGKLKRKIVSVSLSKKRDVITIPYPTRPKMVEFDPREHILMKVKRKKKWQELVFQLQHGSAMLSQARAARQLGDFPNRPKVHKALLAALLNEKLHFTLRRAAATALGKLARVKDCKALIKALAIKEARVRVTVAEQLRNCAEVKPIKALADRMRKDDSYSVRQAAIRSIAKLDDKKSFDLMIEAYGQTENGGRIRIAALSGMMELEDKRSLTYLKQSMVRGMQRRVRLSALGGFARMATFFREKKKKADLLLLLPHLKDPDPFVRGTTVRALGMLGDRRAIPHLHKYAAQAPHRSTAKSVKRAIRMILRQGMLRKRLRRMGDSLESIRKEQRKLLKKFETFEKAKTRGKKK